MTNTPAQGELPYGEWQSPITTDLMVSESVSLSLPSFDGADIYWLEGRPEEGGRSVLVRRAADGGITDVTPVPFDVRSRVHEYGGGAYLVEDGIAWFVNFTDQQVYRLAPGEEPEAVTDGPRMRYADLRRMPGSGHLVAVREDHNSDGEPVNSLVSIDPDNPGPGQIIAGGHDFYAAPRVSPDGARLAWLAWNHPNMPWDSTELWLADIRDDGGLDNARRIEGGDGDSIFQPEWSPGGDLYFVSDRGGWWNIYRYIADGSRHVLPMEAEFGQPLWNFGMRTYAFESEQSIICAYAHRGFDHLARIDLASGKLNPIESLYSTVEGLQASGNQALFIGGSPSRFAELVLSGENGDEVLRQGTPVELDEGYISPAQAVEFPTAGSLTAHAFYYAPRNRDFRAPEGELPPLLLLSHGGPTAAASSTLALKIQYWTSRGFAVVDVNYGGSTGYGRDYRRRLNGRWGEVDLQDAIHAADYLVEKGLADPDRLAIRGGSAGGYTTLAALTFSERFRAGASYYGISDLETLAGDTHKFEARYIDSLVGPYPEARQVYRDRSPIHHVEGLESPVIFFQGLEDEVVPPDQAEVMFEALKKKGVPTALLTFEGEGHGFRRAGNIKRTLEAELYFYGKVFGFTPAGDIEPVDIINGDAASR